ncbi:MAG: hypothetical protein K8M05_07105, partial [Deltaproteobacteria bacterium]|nr:hypothetical protein [Kofleriaceae bacterium]
ARAKRKSTQPPAGRAQRDADRAHADAQVASAAAHGHFSEDEEAFFQQGHADQPGGESAAESFDDLDVGYQRVGFWDRLMGKKPTQPPSRATAKKTPPKKPGAKR